MFKEEEEIVCCGIDKHKCNILSPEGLAVKQLTDIFMFHNMHYLTVIMNYQPCLQQSPSCFRDNTA